MDGTCDEIGRLAAWVAVDATGPTSLTVSVRLRSLDRPSMVAERLPKALIHRNVPGEAVHAYLAALDSAWDRAAPQTSRGAAALGGRLHDPSWTGLAGPGWAAALAARRGERRVGGGQTSAGVVVL